jgi:hypothetical protein
MFNFERLDPIGCMTGLEIKVGELRLEGCPILRVEGGSIDLRRGSRRGGAVDLRQLLLVADIFRSKLAVIFHIKSNNCNDW